MRIMDLNQIKKYLGEDWDNVLNIMNEALISDIDLLNRANDSVLNGGGKKMRLIMSMLMARLCSGGHVTNDSLNFAAAVEILHNATLFHDDVVDESNSRRGHPTMRTLLGSSASVLIGDYWLVTAMNLVLDANKNGTKIIRLFANTLQELAEGEMLQLQKAQNGDTNKNDYIRIIYNKTASLFIVSCVSAAYSVGASERKMKAAKEYARNLGLAFQIKDDIFDYCEVKKIGKPIGQDILEQKITLPLLGAFKNVEPEIEAKVRKAICEIDNVKVAQIIDFVRKNGGIEYAEKCLDDYVSMAKIALNAFEDCQEKEYLSQLADFVAERDI